MTMTFLKLVSKPTVDACNRLMFIQVDEDLGVAQSWVLIPLTGYNLCGDHLGWDLGNKVNGPAGVGLLGVGHEPKASWVVQIPCLTCVSCLVIGSSLEQSERLKLHFTF